MIIFLDIDGVLNQLQEWHIDKACVARLGKICNKTKAKIVLISTWRFGYFHNYSMCTPQVKKLLDVFEDNHIEIQGRTKDLGDRQKEIEDYINRRGISEYIILDDDKSLYNSIKNLYIVNEKTGLTDRDVKEILNKKQWS